MAEDEYKPPATRRITVPTKATQHALIPNKSWEEYRGIKDTEARGVHDEELLKEFHKDYYIDKGENARKAPLVFGPSTGDIKFGIRGTDDYELDQFVVPYTPPFSGNEDRSVGEVMLPETHPEAFKELKFSYEDYKRARKNALLQEGLSEDEYLYESTDQQEIDDIARNYIERDLAMTLLGKNASGDEGQFKYLKEYSAAWDKAQGLTIPFDWEGLGK